MVEEVIEVTNNEPKEPEIKKTDYKKLSIFLMVIGVVLFIPFCVLYHVFEYKEMFALTPNMYSLIAFIFRGGMIVSGVAAIIGFILRVRSWKDKPGLIVACIIVAVLGFASTQVPSFVIDYQYHLYTKFTIEKWANAEENYRGLIIYDFDDDLKLEDWNRTKILENLGQPDNEYVYYDQKTSEPAGTIFEYNLGINKYTTKKACYRIIFDLDDNILSTQIITE